MHLYLDIATRTIVVCSVLHTFLPPFEFLDQFPTAQKYYKLAVYVVGYIAINGRSTVYKSISTQNGTQISQAVIKSNGGNGK